MADDLRNGRPGRRLDAGLAAAQDLPIIEAPKDLAVGENHGFWFFEDGGDFSLHVHLEANAPLWDSRREMVHVLFADGRAMSDWQHGLGTTAEGPGSASTRTRCADPFMKWEFSYRGMPYQSDGAEMAARRIDLSRAAQVPLELRLDMDSGADPWIQGALTPGGMTKDGAEAMGGFRYEQLVNAAGELRVGDERRPVKGAGFRTHRIGPRSMAAFAAHCWMTVLFPSGRGFGFNRIFRPDGSISFDEGYVTDGGALTPARIVEVSILRRTQFSGEQFSIALEADGRLETMQCETVALHHWTRAHAAARISHLQFGADLQSPENFVLNNGCARVRWNGETGYGLVERSAYVHKLLAPL